MPMRSGFRLWLKKRGGRRSGSPRTALAGELLYHTVFIAVGVVALWLHIDHVLEPEWKHRRATADFQPARCEVVETRVGEVDGLAGPEHQPMCLVRLREASQALGDQESTARPSEVWATAGDATSSLRVAQRTLANFTVGETSDCWVDPGNPERVTLYHGRRWWPWLATLIPLSLVALGTVGVTNAFLRVGVSPERRRVVAQSAGGLHAIITPTAPVAGAALPDTAAVTDSPGVRLRYRLPAIGDTGWRVATLATICIAWNLLIGSFVVGVVIDLWQGRPQWAITLSVLPLALAGVYMAVELMRQARTVTGIGGSSVEVSGHPLHPGQRYEGVIIQTGQFKIRALSVALVCEEIATFCEGTDTRTSVLEVYRQVILRQQRSEVTPAKPYEQDFEFKVPTDAMHSFQSAHNEVRWSLETRVTPVRWPMIRRKFLVCVFPATSPLPGSPPPYATADTA